LSEARQRHLAVAAAVLVSAGLSIYLVTWSHWLLGIHGFGDTGYDDGVYSAAATNFVHGVMPYQSFVWVEPPGTVIFLAPLGLLGRLIGTQDMLAVGRVLTIVVTAANAGLVAWLVRCRGRLVMAIAGLTMACFPLTPVADHTLNMEPYFVLYVLLAALTAFDGKGALASPRRLLFAGVLLAVATSFKVWGIALLIALLIACWRQWRHAAYASIGYVAAFFVVSLPFLIMSPFAYWHQMVISQIHRTQDRTNLSVLHRLAIVLGVTNEHVTGQHQAVTVVALVALMLVAAFVFVVRRRTVNRLEWFVLAGIVLLSFGLFHASQFYDHYAYATAALFLPLVAVMIGRLVALDVGPARVRPAVVGIAVLVVLGAFAVPKTLYETRITMAGTQVANPAIDASLPKDACVVGDHPIVLIVANRWNPSSHCELQPDPFGLWIQYEEFPPPGYQPYPKALVRTWQHALNQAAAVVLLRFNDYLLPTSAQDPRLRRQLRSDFTQISRYTRQVIFKRN
jgi:hypothetical protein